MSETKTSTGPVQTDALVIGAGPVGLFQVFQLGLLELSCEVVDALPEPGGQCTTLYPDKPIYDVPGLPVASGRELVARLMTQIAPFDPRFHLGQLVSDLKPLPDGRWQLGTSQGRVFQTHSVFIAAGTGAFLPRTVALPGLEALVGSQLHYEVPQASGPRESPAFAGQQLLVLGDDEHALTQAIALARLPEPQRPTRITLVHRREQFRANEATVAQFQALREAGVLHFVAGQPTSLVTTPSSASVHQPQLQALALTTTDGESLQLPVDHLLILLGLSPRLGPLADWGLALQRRQLVVDPARFETDQPGIYAVGDINIYPGKRKLLLSGFHEATLAAFAAAERQRGEPVLLQYTTTSPRLHRLLGVSPDGAPERRPDRTPEDT